MNSSCFGVAFVVSYATVYPLCCIVIILVVGLRGIGWHGLAISDGSGGSAWHLVWVDLVARCMYNESK